MGIMQNFKFDTIMYDVTMNCNLRCKHCYNADFLDAGSLCEIDVDKIFSAFSKIEFKNIVIQGGEPLIVSNLEELISKFRKKGINVFVTTNGTLLDKGRAVKFIKSGVNGVFFSIESALPEINDVIRGKGSFQTLYTNLRNFVALYSALLEKKYIYPMLISLSTTVSSLNFSKKKDIKDFFIFAEQLGIKDINFNFLQNFGGCKQLNYNENITNLELADFIIQVSMEFPHIEVQLPIKQIEYEYFKQKYGSNINIYGIKKDCPAGDKIVYVNPELKMLPCSWLFHLNEFSSFTKENIVNLNEDIPECIFESFFECKKKYVSVFRECLECKFSGKCIPICPCVAELGDTRDIEEFCPTRKEIRNLK